MMTQVKNALRANALYIDSGKLILQGLRGGSSLSRNDEEEAKSDRFTSEASSVITD